MANELQNIKDGCIWIAEHLAEIQHGVDGKVKFFSYDIEDIFKSLKAHNADPKGMSFFLEEPTISHGGNADNNLHQHWPVTFMLLKQCQVGDVQQKEAIKTECLKACYKVLARFKKWRKDWPYPTDFSSDNLWRGLDLSSAEITFINNIWDGRYGIRCTFELREPIIGQLELDNSDWV